MNYTESQRRHYKLWRYEDALPISNLKSTLTRTETEAEVGAEK